MQYIEMRLWIFKMLYRANLSSHMDVLYDFFGNSLAFMFWLHYIGPFSPVSSPAGTRHGGASYLQAITRRERERLELTDKIFRLCFE